MFSQALIAGLFGLAAAFTTPVGPEPVGNSILLPGLNSIVPAGQPFTITWTPTTPGPVTLVLLKGPAENIKPVYPIVEGTPNNGSFVWIPKTDLEPTENAKGYGIQLIDDVTGQYQYTTQFGISNPDYKKGGETPPTSTSTSSSASSSATAPKPYEPQPPPTSTSTSLPAPYTTGYVVKPTGGAIYPAGNTTVLAPTGYAPPNTLSTTATPSAPPSATYEGPAQQTGAASSLLISSVFGVVAAAGAAVLAI